MGKRGSLQLAEMFRAGMIQGGTHIINFEAVYGAITLLHPDVDGIGGGVGEELFEVLPCRSEFQNELGVKFKFKVMNEVR